MNIIFILLPMAILLGGGGLAAFIYCSRKGQFKDLVTPAYRALLEEKEDNEN